MAPLVYPGAVAAEVVKPVVKPEVKEEVVKEVKKEQSNIKLNVTEKLLENVKSEVKNTEVQKSPKRGLNFNDNDAVINYQKDKSPLTVSTEVVESVSAPKTPERLEKISHIRNEQRKLEEAEEDDDDDFDDEKLKIHDSADLKLDTLDIHSLDKSLKIEKPVLTNIEVLN